MFKISKNLRYIRDIYEIKLSTFLLPLLCICFYVCTRLCVEENTENLKDLDKKEIEKYSQ